MSEENVELVQSFVEAWKRGDYSAALEPVAPEIEVKSNLGGDFDGTFEGIAGAQNWLAGFWSSFVDPHAEIEDYIAGGDEVVMSVHL